MNENALPPYAEAKGQTEPCPKDPTGEARITYVDDEYGSLAQGGSYEVWDCTLHGRHYWQLPD